MANSPPRPLVVGANHRSSSLSVRDRLFVEDEAVPGVLARLRQEGLAQALVLSTCDRVEVQAIGEDRENACRLIREVLAEHAGLETADLDGQLYDFWGDEAVRHVFMVTAALDSMIIGESQILGQVKACHRMARDAGMSGSELEALMQAAYGAAKRVRSDTTIGERPVSIAASAVQVARDVHGDLGRAACLLIGAGDMGRMVAENLQAGGLDTLSVAHPAEARAQAMARTLECNVVSFETLPERLEDADIVITALGGRRYVLSADMVSQALRRRRRKPVFLVDAAVPGDIDPAVNRIDEAFLYDLGDLERVALEGRASRESEAQGAVGIVDREVDAYLEDRAERAAVPALSGLHGHFEAVRDGALADAGGDAEKATRLLVSRLLHGPSRVMREWAAEGEDIEAAERLLRRLFGHDGGGGPSGESGET